MSTRSHDNYTPLRKGNKRLWDEGQVTPIQRTDRGRVLASAPERHERLQSGKTMELYHATTKSAAKQIKSDGQLRRGKTGIVGGGIYFAESSSLAKHKNRI